MLKKCSGASATEAGILIGLISVALIATLTSVGTNLKTLFGATQETLEDVEAGRPVTPFNVPPVWSGQALSTNATRAYTLSPITLPAATDEDGDSLTYSFTGQTYGLSFDPETRNLSGTPTTSGTLTLEFAVSDGTVSTPADFTLTVNPVPQMCADIVGSYLDTGSGTYTILAGQSQGGTPTDVYCDMDTDNGGWTRIDSFTMTSVVNNTENNAGIDDMGTSYGEILFKTTGTATNDYARSASPNWDAIGIATQRTVLILSGSAYVVDYGGIGTVSGNAVWPGCHVASNYTLLSPSNVRILTPSTPCMIAGTNDTAYCGTSVVYDIPDNTHLTRVTDMESYENNCATDNAFQLNYDTFVR